GERFVALESALRQTLADRLFDLALGAHPERLEEFANAAVEHVFVHDRLHYKTNGSRPLTATLKAQPGATSVILNPVFPIIVNATENLTVRRHGHATAPASSAVNSRRFI